LTDDEALEAGLNKMIEDNQDKNSTKLKRLNTLNKMVDKEKQTIDRLTMELADSDYDEIVRNSFKENLSKKSEELEALQKERDQISAQLAHVELTEDFHKKIKELVQEIRGRIQDANFSQKRAIMDMLNVQVVFRVEDDARWLDASCGLTTDAIALHISRNLSGPANSRVVLALPSIGMRKPAAGSSTSGLRRPSGSRTRSLATA
jgi:hypothetical protein